MRTPTWSERSEPARTERGLGVPARERVGGLRGGKAPRLRMVQWGGVDTNVNSLTFGQVTSVRPMRSMTLNLRFRF